MKCDITASGKLIIKSETEIEAYALHQWANSNFDEDMARQSKMDIELNWSNLLDVS
jgi:hypothetical protein